MFRRLCVTLLFLCTMLTAAVAQSTRVRGIVTDAETGEPLPFVGVYFDNTTIGISTDLNGRYSLETRSAQAQVLTAQLIGYESQSAEVTRGAFSEINFALKVDATQLNAALVKPDNRYIKSILKKLDRARAVNDPENGPDWHSRLYSKIEMDITSMEDLMKLGPVNRNLGFLNDYADTSAITGKAYVPALISENISDLYHSKDPSFVREVMRASRISGLEADNILRQFTGSYLLKTNFYKPSITVFNLDIPNPAAASAQMFYNYYLVDSLQVEGRKTYVLRFHPKKLVTSPTIDGEMHIDAEDFGIRSVHAALSAASNVNWIRHINVDIENRRTPEGRWFFGEEKLFIDFSISTSDKSRIVSFLGNRHISYGEPEFVKVTDPDALKSDTPVVMKDVVQGDDQYWAEARPYELTDREKGIYRMVDDFQNTPFYKWSYGILRTLVVGYIEAKPIGLEFGRYSRFIVHNDVEGLRLMFGGRTIKEFSKTIRMGGYIAYGFKDKTPKGGATIELMFKRDLFRKLTLDYKKDFVQLSGGTGVFSAPSMYSSLFARSHANKQTMIRQAELTYEHEFHPSVNMTFSWTSSRLWSNELVPFITPAGLELESFAMHEPRLQFRFSFDERVNRDFFVKTYMMSKYPAFVIGVKGGIKGISKDDFGYVMPYADIWWKTPSYSLGFGTFSMDAGMIFGSVPYPRLKLHAGNQTYFLDKYAFSCMDYYEFASDRWISGFYEHNFNGFFLGKIPLIKKLDLREVATVRWAWGTITPANKENAPIMLPEGMKTLETPYIELGVGLSNILRLIRVDCYWRVTHRREDLPGKNFTVNVGIDVEF